MCNDPPKRSSVKHGEVTRVTRMTDEYAAPAAIVRESQQPPKPYSSDFRQNSASLAVKKCRLLSPLRTK